MINSWSHSAIVNFEKCKRLAHYKHDLKIPEPERPLPPGKLEHANDRGSRIHDGCEQFVNGSSDALPVEAEKHFDGQMYLLRQLYTEGLVSLEGEWAFDREWNPADWRAKDAWLRMKLDALVFVTPQHAIAIDYKSGKKWGNEIKHGEQLQLYQLACFLRYPKLEVVDTELWYLDINDLTARTFTRDQGLRFKRNWDQRGHKITTCTEFPPNPNRFSCQWCPYGPKFNGPCEVGVQS